MVATFKLVNVNASANPEDIAKLIEKMAFLIRDLSAEEVMGDINEDRIISGLPEVEIKQIIAEIGERKRYFRDII